MPRAGELRHRVSIERLTSYLGQWGHESAWRSIATVWASVVATDGGEKFDVKTSGVDSSMTHTVRMRFRADLTTKDRLVHRGQRLEIVSVIDPDGRRRELALKCVTHGSDEVAA